jgi:hypothetical protein
MCREREEYRGGFGLGEKAEFSELPIELAAVSIFEDQENALRVVKPTIESEYIWVAKAGLNLHLSPKLVLNFVLFNLLLEYHLQRHYVFALPK